jgi:hypothetical protein
VVTTQGDDVAHFMKALRSFGIVLLIRIVLFTLMCVAGLVVAVLALSQVHA